MHAKEGPRLHGDAIPARVLAAPVGSTQLRSAEPADWVGQRPVQRLLVAGNAYGPACKKRLITAMVPSASAAGQEECSRRVVQVLHDQQ